MDKNSKNQHSLTGENTLATDVGRMQRYAVMSRRDVSCIRDIAGRATTRLWGWRLKRWSVGFIMELEVLDRGRSAQRVFTGGGCAGARHREQDLIAPSV